MSTFPGGFVPVAPPADGLRLAFVAARRRRNTKAGAAGTAGLLAAVALFASTGGAGDRALMQEPLPPSSTTGLGIVEGAGDPTAAPDSDAATTAQTETAPLTAAGTGTTTSRRVAGSTRTESVGDTSGSSGKGVRSPGTKAVSGPMSRSTTIFYTGDLMCPARKQQERQRGLCTEVYATSSSNNTMSITAQICNVGTVTEMLSFATARELDVAVRHAGLDVWRWSTGRHFAATPHEIMVGTQECVMWTTDWALVDSHGVKVPAGNYEVVAEFDADEVAGADRHPSYPFTVSKQP